ncbi:hypothetical protein F5Y12DRAFT_761928 [Xylaria sp. FL1777]|nr:hypothetical protein F5Y12DRAFT_761928 [Xylaria sp. FL1777]
MTSGFLLFCVPAIPKTIGSIGNGITHIKHYRLRSQESSQKSRSSFKREGPWKSASPDSSNFNRRKIHHPDEVPITTFSSNAPLESELAEQLTASPESPTTGIVRTTRVVTVVDDDVAS